MNERGEYKIKDEDTFSNDEAQSTSFPERVANGEDNALSSPHNVHNETLSSAYHTGIKRRRTSHLQMRLFLVTMVLVVLVAFAGGYRLYHAVSQHLRQTSSPFQVTHCPFFLSAGLVEGKHVTCGFLSVPEDHSLLKSPTIHLAVAIFKSPSSQPAPDPVLFLSGGPGNALLVSIWTPLRRSKMLPMCMISSVHLATSR